jgi:hypothetical protein
MRSGDSPCLKLLIANSRSTRVTEAEKHPEGLPTPTTQGVAWRAGQHDVVTRLAFCLDWSFVEKCPGRNKQCF